MVARRSTCPHTKTIGTSSHVRTCQRALVNADHAEEAGTSSALTSTSTACGSSSAAQMTASRSFRYVLLSSTPSTASKQTVPAVSSETIRELAGLAIGFDEFDVGIRQPAAEHATGRGADRDRVERVIFGCHCTCHYSPHTRRTAGTILLRAGEQATRAA